MIVTPGTRNVTFSSAVAREIQLPAIVIQAVDTTVNIATRNSLCIREP